jgi:hypothetical protein
MDQSQIPLASSNIEPEAYDVFLCHNSEDKPEIRRIADDLIKRGIKPWLDEREIRPGIIWQSALEKQIAHIKSVAIFIGKSGIGPWQDMEIRAFINEFVERKCPVIPAILPSVETAPSLPILLKNLHYVDFRVPVPDPLDQILWGITGEKPEFLKHDMDLVESTHLDQPVLYHPLASPPSANQHAQLQILMNRVDEFWITGVLKQSLFHEVLISLDKKRTDEFVELPWNLITVLPKQGSESALINKRIDQIFDATGLLLILGEPGSGKTTVLIELASHLLTRAKYDSEERIPVILNLSSWQKDQALSKWIQDSLYRSYGVPSKLAKHWLNKGYLLPLLDGLDEVQTEHQADCAEAINAYITDTEPPGLIVCSRLMEYQWLPKRLKMNGAICIEPLNQQQIGSYFAAIGLEFESLRMAIKEDTVLQELAQSPLMLNIMSIAYRSANLEDLIDQRQSVEARRTQIFNAYVDQMFQRKASLAQVFPKEKVIGWLSWLAKKMTESSQSVFLVENLQPIWLESLRQRTAYSTISLLIVGLILGLIFGLSDRLIIGLLLGLSAGLSFGPLLGVTEPYIDKIRKDKPRLNQSITLTLKQGATSTLDKRVLAGLITGIIAIGSFFWLAATIITMTGESIDWAKGGLSLSALSCISAGGMFSIKTVETINWSWKLFFKHLRIFLFVWLVLCLILSLIIWLNLELRASLFFLLFILICGLPIELLLVAASGLTDEIREDKTKPNQGITLTLKNGIIVSIIILLSLSLSIILMFILFFVLLYMTSNQLRRELNGGLSDSLRDLFHEEWSTGQLIDLLTILLIFGLMFGLIRGLGAIIKHYSLRLVLWRSGKTPFKFIPFLDHCAKLILLKKVGGGYIFIHRMLLEYFAKLGAADSKQTKH